MTRQGLVPVLLVTLLTATTSAPSLSCGSGTTNAGADGGSGASPGAPTNVGFTNVGATSVTVSWTAPTSGDPALSYKVERASDTSGSPGSFSGMTAGVGTTTWTDTTVQPSTAYWFRVCGTNAKGDGAWSSAARVVTSSATPLAMKVVGEDLSLDFGRNELARRTGSATAPARDAFPVAGADWPGLESPTNPMGLPGVSSSLVPADAVNVCAFYAPPTFPENVSAFRAHRAFMDDDPVHMDPNQHPTGMTCIWAVVTGTDAATQMGFTLTSATEAGNFYAAVPVPSSAQGAAAIPLQEWDGAGLGTTVADALPGGLVEGSIIDTGEKMAAYTATLAALAKQGALPLAPPLAAADQLKDFVQQQGPPTSAWQALPILWEPPADPDQEVLTHDCVGHRQDLIALIQVDPLCTVPRAGTSQIGAWLRPGTSTPQNMAVEVGYDSEGAQCYTDWPGVNCNDPAYPNNCGYTCCPSGYPYFCEATQNCYAVESQAREACRLQRAWCYRCQEVP